MQHIGRRPVSKLIEHINQAVATEPPSVEEQLFETTHDDADMPRSCVGTPRKLLPFSRGPAAAAAPSRLTDVHPLELARQLTLADSALFRQIRFRECLKQRWSVDKPNAPNVLRFIDQFNAVRLCTFLGGLRWTKSL